MSQQRSSWFALVLVTASAAVWLGCHEPTASSLPAQVVSISPSSVEVLVRQGYRFSVTVTGTHANRLVTWSARRGTVDEFGLYSAPSWPCIDSVHATSIVDTNARGLAVVTVVTGIDSVRITPGSTTITTRDTVRFRASVFGYNGDHSLRWQSLHGRIDSAGLYSAPREPTTDTVRAVSAVDSTEFAIATITVVALAGPRLEWARYLDFDGYQRDGAMGVAIVGRNQAVVGGLRWNRNWGAGANERYGALAGFDSAGALLWVTRLGQLSMGPYSSVGGLEPGPSGSSAFFTGGAQPWPGAVLCGAIGAEGAMQVDPFSQALPEGGGTVMRVRNGRLYIGAITPIDQQEAVMVRADLACVPSGPALTLREKGRVLGLWVYEGGVIASGDFLKVGRYSNIAGWVRQFASDGTLLWERVYDDAFGLRVVSDASGRIYVAGTSLLPYSLQFFAVALDAQGTELWRVSWDGDNPRQDNLGNSVHDLLVNPTGGVVLVGQITELLGNDNCITAPNCWDFGVLALSPAGSVLWKIRQDFNRSSWDAPTAAAFDQNGDLVIVGASVRDDSGDDFADNRDWLITKFRIR